MTTGKMAMDGRVATRVIRAEGPGVAWKVCNAPHNRRDLRATSAGQPYQRPRR